MKKYSKPTLELIELRIEERLAGCHRQHFSSASEARCSTYVGFSGS